MKRSVYSLGADLRDMAKLAAPIVVINLGIQLMGVTDALMVGRLGGAAIASVALGNFYFWNASVFGIGLLFALDPIVSQAVGAKDYDGMARGVQRGIIIALIVSVVVSVMLLPGERLLGLLQQPAEVIPMTAEYSRCRMLGVVPFFIFTVLRQTLQAMGPVRPVIIGAVVANLTNVAGNWLLIFGNMGAPKLGVVGSGYATAASMWIMMITTLIVGWPLLKTALAPRSKHLFEWKPLRRMLLIGIPIGTQWFFESFAFGLTALFMGWMGTASLAGHEIAINMASLTFMVPLGFSGAAAAIVGRAIGRGDIEAAKRDAFVAILCGIGVMGVSAVAFIGAPEWLANRYTSEPATMQVAVMLIPIAGMFQLFDGAQAVTSGVLRGTGDTRIPAILHMVAFWGVGIPLGAFLGFKTQMRERGLWWGLVAGLAAAAILQTLRVIVRFRGEISRLKIDHIPNQPKDPDQIEDPGLPDNPVAMN